eukprot:TRINITY_DN19092_c0_g1_i2.p1 TRINITY_DN19092_c0_g1~~TRINITY_DN19092_c0_g1_i2.p1  ORF type:complete len:633 (+),score=173.13 TRINITY_DN19092_c0_g1_i2:47-1900(+)
MPTPRSARRSAAPPATVGKHPGKMDVARSSVHSPPPGSTVLADARRSPSPKSVSVVSVRYGSTLYRLRNLALADRSVSYLRELLSGTVGVEPERQKLALESGAVLPAGAAADAATLHAVGVRAGDIVELTLMPSLTVLVEADGATAAMELRLNGVDANDTLVRELRTFTARRMHTSADAVQLRTSDGRVLTQDGCTLTSAGVPLGSVLHARRRAAAVAPVPAPAPGRSVQVASSWPSAFGVPGAIDGLRLVTDGLWTTDGALCRGAKPPPGACGAPHSAVTDLPLPPLRADAKVRDLRRVITDLLGLPARAQLLFSGDTPLPAAGAAGDGDTLAGRGIRSRGMLRLAVDRSAEARYRGDGGAVRQRADHSAKTPWCIHCVVARPTTGDTPGDVVGEWRPQFCQPAWTAQELCQIVAQECNEDSALGALYYRGRELQGQTTLTASGLADGVTCLLVFRATFDVSVELRPEGAERGTGQTALLRGVPRDATVKELCRRAAVAAGLPGAAAAAADGAVRCSLNGSTVAAASALREVGVGHGDCVECEVADPASSRATPASPRRISTPPTRFQPPGQRRAPLFITTGRFSPPPPDAGLQVRASPSRVSPGCMSPSRPTAWP